MRQLEGKRRSPARSTSPARDAHSSMRDMEPLPLPDEPDDDSRIADTPRRRPSRIPLHTARPAPGRPPSAHSVRSVRSAASGRSGSASGRSGSAPRKERECKSSVPVRRSPAAPDPKVRARSFWNAWFFKDSGS